MLIGSHAATLLQASPVDIHGTHFYDLFYEHLDAPGQVRRARIGTESIYPEPQPGDSVRITYLMGVVTTVERRDT